jgi:hypothetical protein
MATRAQQKILRIGVIQGGKIVEERLIRSRENVTIGSSPKATLVVPASSLPRSLDLFEVRGGQYHLAFTEAMDGRVSVGNGVLDFAALKGQNLAKRRGDLYTYALAESARGKVTLGELTILFQFVTPPPEPAKPVLPKEARGGWVKSIDKVFTALLVLAFAAHAASFYVFYNTPLPKEVTFDQLPDRFAKMIAPNLKKTKPPPPPKGDKGPGEGKKKLAKKEPPKEDNGDKGDKGDVRHRAASKAVQQRVRSTGLLAIIGSKSSGAAAAGSTLVADIVGSGVSGDLDQALKNVSGVSVATGGDALSLKTGLKGGGDGKAADIGQLATKGGGHVGTGHRHSPVIRGTISAGQTEVDSSTVNAQAISRYIRARMRSITSCYEMELKRNPTLKGKLLVRITINTRGMVGDIEFDEDTLHSNAVRDCVRNRIRPWRFPVKPSESTPVSVPFIFAPAG